MSDEVKRIIIVGGGTSGWITANILASKLNKFAQNVDITLIESENIGIIGVGEGTFPTMRETLQQIGIDENTFLTKTNATFKQAIKFVDWTVCNTQESHSYYHLFDLPITPNGNDITQYWINNQSQNVKYTDVVAVQDKLCDLGFAPKKITSVQYKGISNYAYHLDAYLFAKLLSEHGQDHFNIKHIQDTVIDVFTDNNLGIKYLTTAKNGKLEADLYIDCSGFKSLLLSEALDVPFIDKSDVLFVDHAITVQVPYDDLNQEIPCHTITTAKEAGWVWDIGLTNRRGLGYVYSSRHTSHEEAKSVLLKHIGKPIDDTITTRVIPMKVGHRKKFWHKNCVAIGLSSGFLEPLESTAIVMVEAAAQMLADQFPHNKRHFDIIASQFNQAFTYRWERIIDFVKLHYCISERDDSQFWLDNRDPSSIPDTLKAKLKLWQVKAPSSYDFPSNYETFTQGSYQYVLYGMNYKTTLEYQNEINLDNFLMHETNLSHYYQKLTKVLPKHRELLNQVNEYGFKSN